MSCPLCELIDYIYILCLYWTNSHVILQVFVVGLPMRLADAEILKKHEYFGKYGKIHKVVINQSTTYAGSQVYKTNFV